MCEQDLPFWEMMTDEERKCQEIAVKLYNLRSILSQVDHMLSANYYKDQRGDSNLSTEPQVIKEASKELDNLVEFIKEIQNKIKLLE